MTQQPHRLTLRCTLCGRIVAHVARAAIDAARKFIPGESRRDSQSSLNAAADVIALRCSHCEETTL